MGFLDSLTWLVLGGDTTQIALYNAIVDVVREHPNGLAGIVKQFHAAGLGDLVDSWVGTGTNLPATADHIQHGLGQSAINAIALQTGLTGDEVATRLARLLPRVIDTLTSKGAVTDNDFSPDRMAFLAGSSLRGARRDRTP